MMIRNGHTIEVYRGDSRDRHGDKVRNLVGTIDNVVFSWGSKSPRDVGEEFSFESIDIYCPRNAAIRLQGGDRFKFKGDTYAVVGDPAWDEDNPATGYDFGYYEAQVTVIS